MTGEIALIRQTTREIFERDGLGRAPRPGDEIVPQRLWKSLVASGLADAGSEEDRAIGAAVVREASRHPDRTPLAEAILARWLCPDAPPGIGVVPDAAGRARYGRYGGYAVGGGRARTFVVHERLMDLASEPVDTLSVAGDARGSELGALMRSIQILGAVEQMAEMCVRYAREREQFGRRIAGFQLVRTFLSDIATERAVIEAVVEQAISSPSRCAVAAAKVCAGTSGALACAAAHQLHGAIGTAEEHLLVWLTRRILSWRDDFGGEHEWALELGRTAIGSDQLILDLLAD
jgi:hypothetical protein